MSFYQPVQLVGTVTAISGILVLALPIPIVVENFAAFYEDQKKLEVFLHRETWIKNCEMYSYLEKFSILENVAAGSNGRETVEKKQKRCHYWFPAALISPGIMM